jgi:hypothetical protein
MLKRVLIADDNVRPRRHPDLSPRRPRKITNDGKAKLPTNSPATDGVHLYFIEGMPWTTGSFEACS